MPSPPDRSERRLPGKVVLGTWGLSGATEIDGKPAGYSSVPEDDFVDVLDAAYDAGVRWIDVAPGYGGGAGVRRLAAWQRRRGQSWQVVFKPGRPINGDGPRSDLSSAALTTEIGECVELLGEPATVLIKDPPEEAFRDGSLRRRLRSLRDDHGYSAVGVATNRLDDVTKLGSPPVPGAVVQLEYHMLNRFVSVSVARSLAAVGWRVWGMQPLAYGFLGGRHGTATAFRHDDWRSRMPASVRNGLSLGAAALRKSLPGDLRQHPLAEAALAWCLASPFLDAVVVGPRNRAQFATLHDAAVLAYDEDFMDFVTKSQRFPPKSLHQSPTR